MITVKLDIGVWAFEPEGESVDAETLRRRGWSSEVVSCFIRNRNGSELLRRFEDRLGRDASGGMGTAASQTTLKGKRQAR